MKSKEVEAKKAMDLAEKKLSSKDYNGAKELIIKAQNLNPNLDGSEQLLMMINVYISASNIGEEPDWYGVLGVDSLADDKAVKKQYKRLALLLHPDKNKFNGAEEAFKLILEALCVLSDEAKRIVFDGKRKKKRPKTDKPTSSTYDWYEQEPRSYKRHKPNRASSLKPETFWTMCDGCKTYCEFGKPSFLNKTLSCPNCGKSYVAKEIVREVIDGRPVIRLSPQHQQKEQSSNDEDQETKERTSTDASSSSSSSTSTSASGGEKDVRSRKKRREKKAWGGGGGGTRGS